MTSSTNWDALQFGQSSQKKKSKMMFAPEDDLKMWNFIAENYLNYGPFEIFSKMKEMLGYEHAEKSLYYRFRNILAPNLHFTHFSTETKLQIAKKFNITLNGDFVQDISKSWDLVFDTNGCIEEFSWKNQFSMAAASSGMFLSLTNQTLGKRASVDSSSNGRSKKSRTQSSDLKDSEAATPLSSADFMESLREMITATVMTSNRQLIEELKFSNTSTPQTTRSSGLKNYLEGLKCLIRHLNIPELNDIEKRIDVLEEKINTDEVPLPVNHIHSMLDIGLKMIGG